MSLPEEPKETSQEKAKRIYNERKAAGVCYYCGNPELEAGCKRCKICRDRQKNRQARQKEEGLCHSCGEPSRPGKVFCDECQQRDAVLDKEQMDANKVAVFEAYGGFRCACCGETEIQFLQLDHVNNDGQEDRKAKGTSGGTSFYKKLVQLGFPVGYQVLCCSCNFGKRMNEGYLVQATKSAYLLQGVTPEMRESCCGVPSFTVTGPNQVELTTPASVAWSPPKLAKRIKDRPGFIPPSPA